MNAETKVVKALKLQKEFDEARRAAIEELLTQKAGIDQQLQAFGYDGGATTPVGSKRKVCPVCGEVGHNRRRHRGAKESAPPPSGAAATPSGPDGI